jgi:endoglucanase
MAVRSSFISNSEQFVDYTTRAGAYAMICPHNYGRYYGNPISDVDGFKRFWSTLAAPFKDNSRVIWDTNNECKDIGDAQSWPWQLTFSRSYHGPKHGGSA